MRILGLIVAVLVFGAMLIIDPVALVRLGIYCATGHCGVRPHSLAIAAAILVLSWVVVALILRLRRKPAPPPPPPKPAPRRRGTAPKAASKPKPPGKVRRTKQ